MVNSKSADEIIPEAIEACYQEVTGLRKPGCGCFPPPSPAIGLHRRRGGSNPGHPFGGIRGHGPLQSGQRGR